MLSSKCKYLFMLGIFVTLSLSSNALAMQDDARVLKASVQKTYQLTPGVVGLDIFISPSKYPLIKKVENNLPAYQAGLLAGDRILQIDGTPVSHKSMQEVDELISDEPGVEVTFTVKRGHKIIARTVVVKDLSDEYKISEQN